MLAGTRLAEAAADFAVPFNDLEIENITPRVGRSPGQRRMDASDLGDAKRLAERCSGPCSVTRFVTYTVMRWRMLVARTTGCG